MASQCELVSKNFEIFDPWAYLRSLYGKVDEFNRQTLGILDEFYKSYGSSRAHLKVLEFGAGPVIIYEISASLYASEIVLSEYMYTEKNRKVLQMWIDRDPKAPDWSPFFEYVVQELEGKSKEEAATREEKLRQITKVVIPCDISKDPPIEPACCGPYDVVLSSLCLDSACASLEELAEAVSKLAKYVKPGGKVLLHVTAGPGDLFFYVVGSQIFYGLSIREDALTTLTILQQKGFRDVTIECQPRDMNVPPEESDYQTTLFAIATKNE